MPMRCIFGGHENRFANGTWLKEGGLSTPIGRECLGEVRVLRRLPGLSVDLDDDYARWHRSGKTKIATEGRSLRLTGIQMQGYPVLFR